MSYILDAIQKSDQQRKQGSVPSLPASAVAALAPARSALFLYGPPVLVLILAIGMAAAWVRSWPVEPAAGQPDVAKSPDVSLRQAAPTAPPAAQTAPPAVPMESVPRRKPTAATTDDARNTLPRSVAAKPREEAIATLQMATDQAAPLASGDLPLAIRQQLPPMTVAVHLYSSTPRDRLASINGRTLREGDSLTPDLKLERITPEGMIFSFRGYRFQRGAQ